MTNKSANPKRWKRRLLNKYRIVIVNDKTFEDVRSFKLNLLNVLGATTTLVFLLILSTVLLLVLTPIKEYIPGYSSANLKQKAIELTLKVDSLEADALRNQSYLMAIKAVLIGDIEVTKENIDSLRRTEIPVNTIEHIAPSEKDLSLREAVRLEDKYNIIAEESPKVGQVLFSPIEGTIVKGFDKTESSFGIDFIAPKNTTVKAIAKGIIIFVDWTIAEGYTIVMLHDDGLISVYKHLESVTKTLYDTVSSGQVIGLFDPQVTEETPNIKTKYFHFELWKDSHALDAAIFMDLD